jgi:membrane protein
MVKELTTIFIALRDAFFLLKRKDPLLLASSTAFFATFSLSPILIILVSIFGLYAGSDRINHQLFRMIGSTLGDETTREIESIVNNFMALESNWLITIAGSLFFIFVATTLIGIVKIAIQKIWYIRPKAELRLTHHSRERGTHFGFIIFTGLLLLLSLFIDTRLGMSLDYLQVTWPAAAIMLVRFFKILFTLIMITTWFTALFKILPEANIKWDTAFIGGLLTALLFMAGKFLLGKLLVYSRFETVFGASASFAMLLLFIFYSAFILYFGAAFTYEYGQRIDDQICAGKYTDEYEERVVAK